MAVPTVSLNSGTTIPQLGFGVFQIDPSDTEKAVLTAFEAGYRHIDTAQMYGNEAEVGKAIAASGLDRSELFITSKLNNGFHEPDKARAALDESLQKLGLEQLDLFLIHWPLPTKYDGDYVSTWNVLAEAYRSGKLAAAGVSNFQVEHLERLAKETDLVPAVNQVEVHPYFHNDAVRSYGSEHGIATEAWSPIAQGKVLDDPTLTQIAERVGKSTAQVTLAWHLKRGDIIFPKSTTPERVRENFDIFDISLTDADMSAIEGLDQGEDGRTGPNPDTFDMIPD
ncbi:aldo/keto reductase [Rhodococcus aerolatus]